jgi:hypothetical protein
MTVLPEFHDQLQAAARRQAQRRLPRAGIALRGPLGTIVLIGLSTAVVLAVAVVALTAVRAGRGTTPPAEPRSSVTSSRAGLLQTLGALRTPQTAADRRSLPSGFLGIQSGSHAGRVVNNSNYQRFLRDRGYPQVDPSLVRTAGLASGGALTLVPMTFRQATPHRHGIGKLVTFTLRGPRIEGLALSLRLSGTDRVDVSPSTVGVLRADGLNLFTYVNHQNTGVVVVPDGVIKVRLSRFRVTSRVRVDPVLIPVVTASVHDNIALFHVAAPTVTTRGGLPGDGGSGMYSTDAHAHMTWFGPHGQVLKQTTIDIAFNFTVRTPR